MNISEDPQRKVCKVWLSSYTKLFILTTGIFKALEFFHPKNLITFEVQYIQYKKWTVLQRMFENG